MKIIDRLKGASAYLKRVIASRADVVPRADYSALQDKYNQQAGANKELSARVSALSTGLREKNSAYDELAGKLSEEKVAYGYLFNQYKTLERQASLLRAGIKVAQRDGLEVLRIAQEVKTSRKAMKARVKANASANTALAEWQKVYARPLEERLKAAEQESAALRSVAFSKAVNETLKRDSRAMQVPVAYYGFATHKLYYTPAALELLGEKDNRTDLTLTQLMYPIRKKDRMGIIESLRSGKGLKHHKVLTSSGKELKLTTKPFFYDKNAIGVAIFLYDSRFSVAGIRDNFMYRRLNKIFCELSAQFDLIKEKAKAGKLQPDIV